MTGDDPDDVARRAYTGLTRGTIVKADDSPKLQEVTIRDWFGDKKKGVEHALPYGISFVPLPPAGGKEAEVVVAYMGGNPDHPIVIATSDRRHRPKNLKPGESAHHDDQKQITKIGRDGISTAGKKVEITGGGERPKGDTANHELNEFMKGITAKTAQLEHHVAGLHHVASKLRENLEQVIPTLVPINLATQVTSILNKLPAGLDAMASDVQSKLQDYAQKQLQQGLQKFLNPSMMAGLASVLSGNVEGLIGQLKGQIEGLMASNPALGLIDDLREEAAALASSGAPVEIIAMGTERIRSEVLGLIAQNPLMRDVDAARAKLEGLLEQAGPGLHFLAPLKRATQGLVKSVKFGP